MYKATFLLSSISQNKPVQLHNYILTLSLSSLSSLSQPETYFPDSPPTVTCTSTTVHKSLPRDLIIHTVKLTYKSHEWYITVQRAGLRDCYRKLMYWKGLNKGAREYAKYQRNTMRGRTAFGTSAGSKAAKVLGEKGGSKAGGRRGVDEDGDIVLGGVKEIELSDREIAGNAKKRGGSGSGKKDAGAARAAGAAAMDIPDIQQNPILRNSSSMHDVDLDMTSASNGLDDVDDVNSNDKGTTNMSSRSILDRIRSNTATSNDASDSDSDVSEDGASYGNSKYKITPEINAAQRRLKRYLLNFRSPVFYRTDPKSLQSQRVVIEKYLNDCLSHPRNRTCPEFLAFLEVSAMSFTEGPSLMEGPVNIRCSADTSDRALRKRSNRACCGRSGGCHCVCCVCFCFRKRLTRYKKQSCWGVLKPGSFSLYANRTNTAPVECIMFQPSTVVADQLGNTGSMNGALIVDTAWMAELKFDNKITQSMWSTAIKGAVSNCPYVTRNRFCYESTSTNSLLPDELGSHTCKAQWFVNGKDYFSALYDELNKAKKQILLSGWFLSADVYLKRPICEHPETRLDIVIENACKRGVKVYIMVYHEPAVMNHNTTYTKKRFEELDHDGNLFFLRHADPNMPYFWSHHDKHITIDQEVAFLGGIDATFGRYEDSNYLLRDDETDVTKQIFPGADYGNPRIGDVDYPELPLQDNPLHDRAKVARMPWRDIHSCIKGTVALDVAWHFIQRWNYTRYHNKVRKDVPAILPSGLGSLALSWLDRKDDAVAGVVSPTGSKPLREFTEEARGSFGINAAVDVDGGEKSHWTEHAEKKNNDSDIIKHNSASKSEKKKRPSVGSKVLNFMKHAVSNIGEGDENDDSATVRGGKLDDDDGGGGGGGEQVDDDANIVDTKRVVNPYDPSSFVPESELDKPIIPERMAAARRTSNMFAEEEGGIYKAASIRNVNMMPGVIGDGHKKKEKQFVDVDKPNFLSRTQNARQRATSYSDDAKPQVTWGDELEPPGEYSPTSSRPNSGRRVSIAEMMFDREGEDSPVPDAAPMLKKWSTGMSEGGSGSRSFSNAPALNYSSANHSDFVQCKCQVVRSYSRWSAGLSETEDGIQEAYKQLINNSQHFIYIENQFFVSACGEKDSVIGNTVVNCLFNRIFKAHAEGSKFRILISIPLLPGMNGAVKGDGLSGIACVLHFQFRTMSRGGNSLYERLKRHHINPDDYIFITGLRTHQEFSKTIETEMVYIHSKLMIVDDRKSVIGSANINDRSMMGYKDSEICVIVEDTLHVDGRMNGEKFMAGPYAKGLRLKAWGDNLGLDESEYHLIDDPLNDKTWELILGRARKNTQMYEKAFPGLSPSNQIHSLANLVKTGKEQEDILEEANRHSLMESIVKEAASKKGGKSGGAHEKEGGWSGAGVGGWGGGKKKDSNAADKLADDAKKKTKAVHSDTLGLPINQVQSVEADRDERMKKQELRVKMARLSKASSIKKMGVSGEHHGENDEDMQSRMGEMFVDSNPMARGGRSKRAGSMAANRQIRKEREGNVYLEQVKGILCEYPLDFLKDDFTSLKTTMIPSEIFK
jgi:phosphatidylserine/phosphatidylglycerophosphate/cardiolipin synthase-like enzyme